MESTHSLHQVPVQVSNVSVSIPLSQSILEILSRKPPQERTVLSDISFNASPGQLIAIMGASGSGKVIQNMILRSTLLSNRPAARRLYFML